MSDLADVVVRDPFVVPQRLNTEGRPIDIALKLIYKEQGWRAQDALPMLVNRASRPMNVIGSTKELCRLCQEPVWLAPSSLRETDATIKLCMPCVQAAFFRATADAPEHRQGLAACPECDGEGCIRAPGCPTAQCERCEGYGTLQD